MVRPCCSLGFGLAPTTLTPVIFALALLGSVSGFAAVPPSAPSSSSWSPADNWDRLSSESGGVDTAALFNADLTGEAARKMEAEADLAAADLAMENDAGSVSVIASPDDVLVDDAIVVVEFQTRG